MARTSRPWLAAAALSLALVYWLPLWHIGLQAPQYAEGLGLYIAVNRIVGEKPQDLESINNLNHYIGMHTITREELRDLDWIPFGLVAMALLALRGRLRWPVLEQEAPTARTNGS